MTEKRGIADEVLGVIRSRIVDLSYPPGAPISENDLATQLGVSRTPVRAALQVLEKTQLVKVYPRRGTFVSKVDVAMVAECQFLREAVEVASLKTLQLPLDSKWQDEIVENLQLQQKAVADDQVAEFLRLDNDFHRVLMHAAGHDYSWEVITDAKPHLDRARIIGFHEGTPIDFYLGEHQDLYDAILRADVESAETLLTKHLRHVYTDVDKAKHALPEFFADANGQESASDYSAAAMREFLSSRLRRSASPDSAK